MQTRRGKGLGAESEEKREPVSDIDTVPVDSLKVLDPDRPIREADIERQSCSGPRGAASPRYSQNFFGGARRAGCSHSQSARPIESAILQQRETRYRARKATRRSKLHSI